MPTVEDKIAALRDRSKTGDSNGSGNAQKRFAKIMSGLNGKETVVLLKAYKQHRLGKISSDDMQAVFRHLVKKSRSRTDGQARGNGAAGRKRGSNA